MNIWQRQNLWAVLAVFLACQSSAVAQNLIVNGGFDADATGWSATNNAAGGYSCCKGNPGGLFWLDSSPSTTNDPTVSQVVTGLIAGVSYTVSGDYEKLIDRGGGASTDLSFGVALGGVLLCESRQTDFAWHHFGFSFVGAAPSIVLSISAQRNGTGVAYAVDNIVLQPTPLVTATVGFANVVLAWPTNALGFSLQSSSNLAIGSWSNVTNPAAVIGSNYSVILSPTLERRFFRLTR